MIDELHTPQDSARRWFAATFAALGRDGDAQRLSEQYLERYPDFDLDDHVMRVPFRHEADREHYAHWMREAGFAREPCTA